ncbi:CPBP family intramembrane glutamic endopeptidase [Litorihabitans aurantiacus]|uniref:CAAX prenyl protease 2/Lysostaphin resistance protein A-like domain-containing protein n=1 Tax=Litorihabitans aurantiacus TaxID=1930061 RepID=A0AA38CUC1_9MICO|nr:CPBP family intramembrane glutamic endopeptidase [Litorihabitans aurantiacus]GMA32035.1 hypothetical protein GCM10025875_20270 [Litorihabitans aurantiacus]
MKRRKPGLAGRVTRRIVTPVGLLLLHTILLEVALGRAGTGVILTLASAAAVAGLVLVRWAVGRPATPGLVPCGTKPWVRSLLVILVATVAAAMLVTLLPAAQQPWTAVGAATIAGRLGLAALEELLFRVWLPHALGSFFRTGVTTALPVLGSAVLFAAIHAPVTVTAAIYHVAFGVAMSLLLARLGNLVVVVLAHAATNIVLVSGGGIDLTTPAPMLALLAMTAGFLLVSNGRVNHPGRTPAPGLVGTAASSPGRIDALDLLRGVAMLLVVLDNALVYRWSHERPAMSTELAAGVLGNLGLVLLVVVFAASLDQRLAPVRHSAPTVSGDERHARLWRLGAGNATLWFPYDVLTMYGPTGALTERMIRPRGRWIAWIVVAGVVALILANSARVASADSVLGDRPAFLPTSLVDHVLEAFVAVGLNVLVAPLFACLAVAVIHLVRRTRAAGTRSAWLALTAGLAALLALALPIATVAFGWSPPGTAPLREAAVVVTATALTLLAVRSRWVARGLVAVPLVAVGRRSLTVYLLVCGIQLIAVPVVIEQGVVLSPVAVGLLSIAAAVLVGAMPRGVGDHLERYVRSSRAPGDTGRCSDERHGPDKSDPTVRGKNLRTFGA